MKASGGGLPPCILNFRTHGLHWSADLSTVQEPPLSHTPLWRYLLQEGTTVPLEEARRTATVG